jgi:uncharacterized protein
MSVETANRKIVLEFLGAFSAGDFDEVFALLDDQATWWANGTVEGISGRRTKQQFAVAVSGIAGLSTTGGLPVVVLSSTAEGNRVAVEAKSDATFTNGKTYRNDYVFMFALQDGKITEVKEYMDTELARDAFTGTRSI